MAGEAIRGHIAGKRTGDARRTQTTISIENEFHCKTTIIHLELPGTLPKAGTNCLHRWHDSDRHSGSHERPPSFPVHPWLIRHCSMTKKSNSYSFCLLKGCCSGLTDCKAFTAPAWQIILVEKKSTASNNASHWRMTSAFRLMFAFKPMVGYTNVTSEHADGLVCLKAS